MIVVAALYFGAVEVLLALAGRHGAQVIQLLPDGLLPIGRLILQPLHGFADGLLALGRKLSEPLILLHQARFLRGGQPVNAVELLLNLSAAFFRQAAQRLLPLLRRHAQELEHGMRTIPRIPRMSFFRVRCMRLRIAAAALATSFAAFLCRCDWGSQECDKKHRKSGNGAAQSHFRLYIFSGDGAESAEVTDVICFSISISSRARSTCSIWIFCGACV
jgi:hypothetical protein